MQVTQFRPNVSILYAYWFFHSLIFAYVIERLFALERGMTVQQMVYLEILYAVIVALLEIPTGALADRWSRSKMMVLSAAFVFFEFFILIYAYDFWMFALSALCAAIGGALASGTSNALLYDSLKISGEQLKFEKILGRMDLSGALSGVIATLVGGLIAATMNLTATYFFSLIGPGIALLLAMRLRDPPIRTTTGETLFWQHIKDAFLFIRHTRAVAFIIGYGTVIGSTWIYVDEFWQIYVEQIGIPLGIFGLIGLWSLMAEGVGGLLAPRLKEHMGGASSLSWLLVAALLSLLALSLTHSPIGLLFLFSTHIAYYSGKPIILGLIHHRTESRHRATVDSFQALIHRLGTILVGLPFGYLATEHSIFAGFAFLGVLILAYAICFLALRVRFLQESAE
jgi:MFS family permease